MIADLANAAAAVHAASLAGHYEVAIEIALRTGLLDTICIGCAGVAEEAHEVAQALEIGVKMVSPKFIFEAREVGAKITTCADCTEPFARWVAAGGLKRWLSDEAVRAGVAKLQREINQFLPNGSSIAVDGIVGPATTSALQRLSRIRRALRAI